MTPAARDIAVAVLRGAGDLRIESRPAPVPSAHEVLVEIRSVGVCGSDVHYFEQGRIGDLVVEAPLVLGHESSGVIRAVGAGVSVDRIGKRVALEPGVPCGSCVSCRRGAYNLCPSVRFFATPPIDGALAELVTIDAGFAYDVPDSLSDDAAALVEPLSVGLWANQRAGTAPPSRVVVTGAGPIGILCALVSRLSGAREVTLVDTNAARLEQARLLGIDQLLRVDHDVDLSSVRADTLIECTGDGTVVDRALRRLGRRGRAVLVGLGAPDQTLPVAHILSHEIELTGAYRYANTYPAAIAIAASGRIDLDALVGARVSLEHAAEGLRMRRTDPSVLKTIIEVSVA